jgi:hypothetical protein
VVIAHITDAQEPVLVVVLFAGIVIGWVARTVSVARSSRKRG